jgi:TolB protein
VRGGKEIRIVESDGTNDRRLWAHPLPEHAEHQGIVGLAWRPDGQELAFSSGHEAAHSLFQSDLYAIRPDGTGLRRITNPPARDALGRFPKGKVSLTVRNGPANVGAGGGDNKNVFVVYVAGAAEPQTATVPPGHAQTLTFDDVADFGDGVAQPVVAINGPFRWFAPGADVRAGAGGGAAEAVLDLQGPGVRDLGAFAPLWRHDGKRIGYWAGRLWSVPADAKPGASNPEPLMAGDDPPTVTAWDWGPTAALADQILYAGSVAEAMISGEYAIYRTKAGAAGRGEKLCDYRDAQADETVSFAGLAWLPDGTGFLFAKESTRSALETDASGVMSVKKHAGSSLHRFDFAGKKVTLVKEFPGKAVRSLAVSPDGRAVVLEFGTPMEDRALGQVDPRRSVTPELWIMPLDGAAPPRLLVKDAQSPAWRPAPR